MDWAEAHPNPPLLDVVRAVQVRHDEANPSPGDAASDHVRGKVLACTDALD
jgi:hypothetical protein